MEHWSTCNLAAMCFVFMALIMDNQCRKSAIATAPRCWTNAAAYAVRHLVECVPPEALDVPYLSAVVTVRRLRELERRYGKRTAEARAMAWRVGVGG